MGRGTRLLDVEVAFFVAGQAADPSPALVARIAQDRAEDGLGPEVQNEGGNGAGGSSLVPSSSSLSSCANPGTQTTASAGACKVPQAFLQVSPLARVPPATILIWMTSTKSGKVEAQDRVPARASRALADAAMLCALLDKARSAIWRCAVRWCELLSRCRRVCSSRRKRRCSWQSGC